MVEEKHDRKERWKVCKTFSVHRRTPLVPEREVIWLKPHTANKRQTWARIEGSMKAETSVCFAD